MPYDLEFEKPLAELEKKVIALRRKEEHLKPIEREQLQKAERDLVTLTQDIYAHLTDWQTVLVSRHKNRPHTVDYLRLLCDNFFELHGDRSFADNATIVGGPARFAGQTVMFLGQEKGRTLKEQRRYNAAMMRPEGFRKAHRFMRQAEKFSMPIISLVDTPGASIAIDDEARGQSRSIAANLYLMAQLRTPIIAVVIGEGGSGGALGIALADRVLALEHTYYAVASPESSATIAWRDEKLAPQMANAQRICAKHLKEQGLIDEIIPEPPGGAHSDYEETARVLKATLQRHLAELLQMPMDELQEKRYEKFRNMGPFGIIPQEVGPHEA